MGRRKSAQTKSLSYFDVNLLSKKMVGTEIALKLGFALILHALKSRFHCIIKNGTKWYELEPSRDKGGDLNRYGRFLGYGRKCVFGKNVDVVVN